jgi:hypothetical protein
MKIPPSKWGPHFWMTLHIACLGCQDPKVLADFVEGYKEIIPCLSCREHFEQVLVDNPVPETDDLFKWSVDVHNIVNKQLGKPEFSYEAALTNIVTSGAQVNSQFDFKIVFIIVLLVIISFLILNRK